MLPPGEYKQEVSDSAFSQITLVLVVIITSAEEVVFGAVRLSPRYLKKS